MTVSPLSMERNPGQRCIGVGDYVDNHGAGDVDDGDGDGDGDGYHGDRGDHGDHGDHGDGDNGDDDDDGDDGDDGAVDHKHGDINEFHNIHEEMGESIP